MAVENKERLRVIGKLIGIYREELRENSQNEYTLGKFCEGICSVNTLKNIEMGKTSRSEDIYVELLRKLNLDFDHIEIIDKAIFQIMNELYDAIDFFDNEKIDELTTKALRLLETVKGYVYYSELYEIMEDVRRNYLEGIVITEFKNNRYQNLINIMSLEFKNIMLLLMFNWIRYEFMNDAEVCKTFIDDYDVSNNELVSVRMIMLYYYTISSQYMLMNEMVDEFEIELTKTSNKNRLVDIYNYGIIMRSYTDSAHLDEYIVKQEDLSKTINVSKFKRREINSIIGNALHSMSEYNRAISYYQRNLEYNNDISLFDVIYLADCQNRLNLTFTVPEVRKAVLLNYSSEVQSIYNYFAYEEIPNFEKENFILKQIAPKLEDEGFIKIFRYEIERLVDETGHYKVLYNFEKTLSGKMI